MFFCEFSKISRNNFFIEHIRATAFGLSFAEKVELHQWAITLFNTAHKMKFFRNVTKNGHASSGFGYIYWRNP